MTKIKHAIIFASGVGRRLRPLTYVTPKALIKVDGTPIIENTINALFENGITNIYIVVGHQKERFLYLEKKYLNLQLIVDPDYTKSLSISALAASTDLFNNDLIIVESDIVIYDKSILTNKIDSSHYLYFTNKFQNNTRGVVIDFLTKKVKEIRAPKKDVYLNNVLFGVSKWLKKDLLVLKEAITNALPKAYIEDFRLEDIVNEVLDKINLTVKEITPLQGAKVATLEELIEVDSTYLDLKSLNLLDTVLGIKKTDITKVSHSPGRSLNNTNYVVEAKNKKYLLRIPGIGTELFCDREIEALAFKELSDKSFIEKNYFLDPISGIKISYFYDNNRIIDSLSDTDLNWLMEKLRLLHTTDISLPVDTVFDRIKRYDSFVKKVKGEKYYEDDFSKLLKEILTHEESYLKTFTPTLIHGDLSPNNAMIVDDEKLLFIDLEFISNGDPFMDVANFAHDDNSDVERTIEFLEMYLTRVPTTNEVSRLLLLCAAISLMWYIWAVYKMTVETDKRKMYQEYRDLYLDWAKLMYDAFKESNKI